MKLLTILTLLTICLAATGQTFDTEFKYTDSAEKGITIQNSLPKGGLRYTAGLALKDRDLLYRITGKEDIPCGRIVFKKL